jgi:hypothetical protein
VEKNCSPSVDRTKKATPLRAFKFPPEDLAAAKAVDALEMIKEEGSTTLVVEKPPRRLSMDSMLARSPFRRQRTTNRKDEDSAGTTFRDSSSTKQNAAPTKHSPVRGHSHSFSMSNVIPLSHNNNNNNNNNSEEPTNQLSAASAPFRRGHRLSHSMSSSIGTSGTTSTSAASVLSSVTDKAQSLVRRLKKSNSQQSECGSTSNDYSMNGGNHAIPGALLMRELRTIERDVRKRRSQIEPPPRSSSMEVCANDGMVTEVPLEDADDDVLLNHLMRHVRSLEDQSTLASSFSLNNDEDDGQEWQLDSERPYYFASAVASTPIDGLRHLNDWYPTGQSPLVEQEGPKEEPNQTPIDTKEARTILDAPIRSAILPTLRDRFPFVESMLQQCDWFSEQLLHMMEEVLRSPAVTRTMEPLSSEQLQTVREVRSTLEIIISLMNDYDTNLLICVRNGIVSIVKLSLYLKSLREN